MANGLPDDQPIIVEVVDAQIVYLDNATQLTTIYRVLEPPAHRGKILTKIQDLLTPSRDLYPTSSFNPN